MLDPAHFLDAKLISTIKDEHICDVKYRASKTGAMKYVQFKSESFKSAGINALILFRNSKGLVDVEFKLSKLILDLRDQITTPNTRTRSDGFIITVSSEEEVKPTLESVLKSCDNFGELAAAEDSEEDSIGLERVDIESTGYEGLSELEKIKYDGFWEISKKLNNVCGSIFHVDHAHSVKEHGVNSICHKNLQLLIKGLNTSKSSKSWDRLCWEAQKEHIKLNTSIIPNVNQDVVDLYLSQLKTYWDE